MKNRPYFKTGIDQLQALYEDANGDQRLLQALEYELQFRDRPKAKVLKAKVDDKLKRLRSGETTICPHPVTDPRPEPISVRPGEPVRPAVPDRVGIECAHCNTNNFVSTLDGLTQHLSCAHCKASYEAVFKYGVMRTKFEDKKADKSQSSILSWIVLGMFILVITLLMVK